MNKLLAKKEPEKRLLLALPKRSGHSSSGRITTRHKGGGVKKLYRMVDFGQEKIGVAGKIAAIEYDPYRTAFIALVEYKDRDKRYVLAPKGLKEGDEIICAESVDLRTGNRTKLKNLPLAAEVFNIEVEPGKGGRLIRSAGATAVVAGQESLFTHLEMPSGEIRKFSGECFATIGAASHQEHVYEILGKAGRNRLKGKRPTVRGSAMIPVAHPHGGGNGKTPIGLKFPKTPWGKPARGVQTRKRFWTDRFIIQRRTAKEK